MTGKLKGGLFLWCCYNNAVGEILARYEREKDIRKVVIKIHTMKIAMDFCNVKDALSQGKDALLRCERRPFAA